MHDEMKDVAVQAVPVRNQHKSNEEIENFSTSRVIFNTLPNFGKIEGVGYGFNSKSYRYINHFRYILL